MSIPAVDEVAAQESDPEPQSRTRASSSVIANIGALGIAQILTWTLTLVWTLWVPRVLGPAGTGLLVLVWSANGLLMTFCGLGSRTLLVREIARDATRAPQLMATALVVRAASAVPCVALVFLYVLLGRFRSPESLVLYLAAALTVLTLLAEPLQAAFQGIEKMRYLAYGDVTNKAVFALLGIALVLLGFGAVALVWLMLAAAIVVLLLDWLWLRSYIRVDWSGSLRGVGQFLRQSTSYWAYTVFHSVYLWGDSALIGVLAPTEVLGYYGVPSKLFGTFLFVATIMSTAWLPRLSAAHVQGPETLKETARTPLTLALVLSLPVAVGAALVAEPLLTTLYGPAFRPAIPVLMILAATTVPTYLNIVLSTTLIAAGRQNVCTVVLSAGAVFNIVSNFALIRYFQGQFHNGAIGAAIALLTTEFLMALISLVIARRYLSWQILPRALRSLLATLFMAVAVLMVHRFSLITQVATGLVSFAVMALLLGVVTRHDREMATAFVSESVRRVFHRRGSERPSST